MSVSWQNIFDFPHTNVLVRLDEYGEVIWTKTFTGTIGNAVGYGTGLLANDDGSVVFSHFDVGKEKTFLHGFDEIGTAIFSNAIHKSEQLIPYGFAGIKNNGQYLLTGSTSTANALEVYGLRMMDVNAMGEGPCDNSDVTAEVEEFTMIASEISLTISPMEVDELDMEITILLGDFETSVSQLCPLPLSAEIDDVDHGFSVYPNPNSGILHFESENGKEIHTISVMDAQGRLVKAFSENNLHQIDISDLQSGVYMIRFAGGDSEFIQRVVVL